MLDIVIGGLAVWEICEIWNHGSIFASWRSAVEDRGGRFASLLRCMFCTAPWVALAVLGWTTAVRCGQWSPAWLLPIHVLAAARLANLGNDVFHPLCRTPAAFQLPEETYEHEQDQSDRQE